MRIALAQIRSTTSPQTNVGIVEKYSRQAADAGARLVIFPEATMCRFGVPLSQVAEPLDGAWANAVRSIAVRTNITIIAGMFRPIQEGKVANTLLVTGPDVETYYDKIHLYDAFGFHESHTVISGLHPVIANIGGVNVGLTTCYDIRFPELYTTLAHNGAQLIVVCASWGAGPGKLSQWTLLSRARALDSSCYLAGVDQASTAPESSLPLGIGHSLVVNPLGTLIAHAGSAPQLLLADLDLDIISHARDQLGVLTNRKMLSYLTAGG